MTDNTGFGRGPKTGFRSGNGALDEDLEGSVEATAGTRIPGSKPRLPHQRTALHAS